MRSFPNDLRDGAVTAFRQRICSQIEIIPLRHQQKWFCAADGATLLDLETDDGVAVTDEDNQTRRYGMVPRPEGRARVIADLGAYKCGKSFSTALFASSFACVPNARVQLIALEYDIAEPEFNYILEFLLSERGMGLKAASLQNRPRDGKMWLDLPNGARYEAKSWERKDSLKGKEVDLMAFCEAYMLPGLECYTSFSQNLRARDGYAIFATTPDRPWLNEIHEKAHSGLTEFRKWHCTCGVTAKSNPITFDQEAMDRDRHLMTKEKFQIHYLGQIGEFVGRVYGYQRGQKIFTPESHPDLWKCDSAGRILCADIPRIEDLSIPNGWEIVSGADTGTFSSAGCVAFSPDGDAFVLAELPNYRYVGGSPELNEDLTIPEWSQQVVRTIADLGGRPDAWADKNSQFKREVANYGLHLMGATHGVETRTEIAREYFTQNKIYFAPWLSVLPFEIENAQWPDEASAAGKFARVKDRDHSLDWLEHILARRPRGVSPVRSNTPISWAESVGYKVKRAIKNVHLGQH